LHAHSAARGRMRQTIEIRGARENYLRDVSVEFPRQKLVVVTGVSGSGKSSLAFDTLYAEGQRRLLDSMSSFVRRFVSELKKPDVDFVYGLSPVVSIDQKTISKNPRSTVGTMTDIFDYLRMLYATIGQPRCPVCEEPVSVRSPRQLLEHMLSLPVGSEVEIRTPVPKVFDEDYDYLLETIRAAGYRRARIDGKLMDIGEELKLDESRDYFVEAVIDVVVIKPGIDE
jgi:excinuclease ABC subunit A